MNADQAYSRFEYLKSTVYGNLLNEFQLDEDMFVEQKPVQAASRLLEVEKYEPPT